MACCPSRSGESSKKESSKKEFGKSSKKVFEDEEEVEEDNEEISKYMLDFVGYMFVTPLSPLILALIHSFSLTDLSP